MSYNFSQSHERKFEDMAESDHFVLHLCSVRPAIFKPSKNKESDWPPAVKFALYLYTNKLSPTVPNRSLLPIRSSTSPLPASNRK